MKNRILHILWDGHHGGVQRYVQKVITSDKWTLNEHLILLLSEEGKLLNTTESLGVEILCLNISSKFQIKKCYDQIKKLVTRRTIDLIHCHCDSLFILTQLRFLNKCKMVYTEHGDSFVRTDRQMVTELLWKLNGSSWDRIILNSSHTKEKFVSKFSYLQNAIEVISNPLLEEVQTSLREVNKSPRIGTLGRLVKIKGNDLFLEAADKISKVLPQATFHIYGDGTEKQNLQMQTYEKRLTNKVTFHGFTSDPLNELKKLDCLVVPSRAESFGLSAVEALASGTPVAAFSGTGVADFIIPKLNGSLARMEDTSALAESVIYILKEQNNWRRLSMNGMETVREQFSLEKHILKLEQTYTEILHEEQQKETA